MDCREPIEITADEARKITEAHANRPTRNTVMSLGDRWFDIRHLNGDDLVEFIKGLGGRVRH
jgi:hypothetical protein